MIYMLKVQNIVQGMATLSTGRKKDNSKSPLKRQCGFYSIIGPFGLHEKHLLNLPDAPDLSLISRNTEQAELRNRPETELLILLLSTGLHWEGSSYTSLLKTR